MGRCRLGLGVVVVGLESWGVMVVVLLLVVVVLGVVGWRKMVSRW